MTIKQTSSLPLAIFVLLLSSLACNAVFQQMQPTATPQRPARLGESQNNLPKTEADVPRVTAEEAKAAFENGQAIIVDVRSAEAYAASHIRGAISVPLDEIELNPTGLNLGKGKWIITYCT